MSSTMHRLRRQTRPLAWLALCAIVLQLMAGFVSSAHAGRQLAHSSNVIEICTSAGLISISFDEHGKQVPAHQGAPAAQHCPFCATQHPGYAPLAVALFLLLPAAEPATTAPPLPDLPHPRVPDLRHAPSRAPPSLFA